MDGCASIAYQQRDHLNILEQWPLYFSYIFFHGDKTSCVNPQQKWFAFQSRIEPCLFWLTEDGSRSIETEKKKKNVFEKMFSGSLKEFYCVLCCIKMVYYCFTKMVGFFRYSNGSAQHRRPHRGFQGFILKLFFLMFVCYQTTIIYC